MEQKNILGGRDSLEKEDLQPAEAERQTRRARRRSRDANQAGRALEYRRDNGRLS